MSLSQTGTFVETIIDLVDGVSRANLIGFSSNNKLVLNGAAGADGGSGIPWGGLVGGLIQRRVCFDTTEAATPCILPSSSLLDNLNRMRWRHRPATWFEMTPTDPRSMQVHVASGLWYKDEADEVDFTGGDSPIITSPVVDPRIDVIYLTASGIVAVSEGTESASPTYTIPSGTLLPIGAIYVTPVACGIGWPCDTSLYSGYLYSGYIYKDLRPFVTYPGGGGGVDDHNALNGLQGGQGGPISQFYHLTQTQYIPTRGDIYYGDATPTMARLPIGAATFILRSDGTDPSWVNPALYVPLPPVAEGDLIYANAIPAWIILPRGTTKYVLHMNGGLLPEWIDTAANIPVPPAGNSHCLISAGLRWTSAHTPNWTGEWFFEAGIDIIQGVTMADTSWIGNDVADMRIIFHAADHIEIATNTLNIYTIDKDPSAATPMTATAANIQMIGGDNATGDDAGLWLRNEETNVDWSIYIDESDYDHFKIARDNTDILEIGTTGNITLFSGNDFDPEDATGQDLGSSAHRWDLYANDINMDNGGVIHCTTLGGPIITFDSISDYLEITECRVSIGHDTPVVALDINTPTWNHNGILLGSGGPPAHLGMIKFTGIDFFGFTPSGWLSLTASGIGGGGVSLWTDYGAYIEPSNPRNVRISTGQEIYPEDATGQDLGRAGNRWDIWARNIDMSDAGWIGNSGATARLHFDSSGATDYAYFMSCNVGILTATPDFPLDVAGDARIEGANKLYFGGTGAADFILSLSATLAGDYASLNVQAARANDSTVLAVMPKGVSPQPSQSELEFYGTDFIADGVNWERLNIRALAATYDIVTEANGTGTIRPIVIYTSGNTNQLVMGTNGGVSMGTATTVANLELHATAGNNVALWLTDADVSHPFTAVGFNPEIEADVLGAATNASGAAGGVQFIGFTDNDTTPFWLFGHIGNAAPANPAVVIGGWKTDGGTSRAALANTETVLQIRNGATVLATTLGSGYLGLDAVPNVQLQLGVANTNPPALGAWGGSFSLSKLSAYGLQMGVAGTGNAWMQVARTDTVATAYNLLLQPQGGNVGIGTGTPAERLTVEGTAYPVFKVRRSTALTNELAGVFAFVHETSGNMVDGFGPTFGFQIKDAASGDIEIAYIAAIRSGADTIGSLVFATANGAAPTPKAYINELGYVGIGVVPGFLLESRGTQQDAIQTLARMGANNAGAQLKTFDIKLTAGTPEVLLTTAAVGVDPRLSFSVGGAAAQMTIAVGGNVGIAEANPQRLLHVDGRVRIDDVGTEPGVTAGGGFTHYYGSLYYFCGKPEQWLRIDIEGNTYHIPCYS